MTPRWMSPRQSAWGLDSPKDGLPMPVVAVIGVVILALGIAIGVAFKGDSGPSASTPSPEVKANPVIAPDVALVGAADRSPEGAVKAATGFITGISNVALTDNVEQSRVLGAVIAPDADPQLRQVLQNSLTDVRASLKGPAGAERQANAKLITNPASYRVETPPNVTDQAKVTVWYVSVLVDGSSETARSYWATATLNLKWSDHWRLTTYETKIGPTPQVYAQDAQFSNFTDVTSVFNNFRAYRYAIAQ